MSIGHSAAIPPYLPTGLAEWKRPGAGVCNDPAQDKRWRPRPSSGGWGARCWRYPLTYTLLFAASSVVSWAVHDELLPRLRCRRHRLTANDGSLLPRRAAARPDDAILARPGRLLPRLQVFSGHIHCPSMIVVTVRIQPEHSRSANRLSFQTPSAYVRRYCPFGPSMTPTSALFPFASVKNVLVFALIELITSWRVQRHVAPPRCVIASCRLFRCGLVMHVTCTSAIFSALFSKVWEPGIAPF